MSDQGTQEFFLRAMAQNYAGGHQWDDLDGKTCIMAADEIASLRAQLAARPAPTRKEIAQTIWIKWRGYNPSNDQLENSTTGHEFLAIADAILALFAQSDELRGGE